MGCVIDRSTRRDRPLWYGRWKDENGRWITRPTHQPTREQAKRYVATVEGRIAGGRVGVPQPPNAEELARRLITVRQLGERFTAEYNSPRVKSPVSYRKMAQYLFEKHVYDTLGAIPAAQLTTAQLERLRDKLREEEKLAPQSVRHVLAYISRLYSWSIDKGILECANPTAKVERPRLERDDDDFNYLSADEVASLLTWAALHQPTEFPLYACAAYSGMRKGELCGLRWTDVDFDRGVIAVRRSFRSTPKSGKGRHIPINPRLTPILRAWKALCPTMLEGLVFPAPSGPQRGKLTSRQVLEIRTRVGEGERRSVLAREYSVSWTGLAKAVRGDRAQGSEPKMRTREHGAPRFKAALAGASCHEVRFHDLRHTFASHFVMAGGNILTLQRLLGHSSVKVTEKYSHLRPDFMAAEGARVSFEPKHAVIVGCEART